VDTIEFDAALVEDVAAQDDLVSEDVAAVAVNFDRSDGCVADRQIEIGILHGMAALGKSSAANHEDGFLFEHLADEQVLIGALGENPLGEGLFAGIVIQDDAILECDKFAGIGCQKVWFGRIK
jgi:hypothetical protein